MYSFKKFISLKEWADFGFGEKLKKPAGGTKPAEGHMPIDIIHSSKIISELLSTPEIGNYIANPKFQNLIEWGDEAGALQLQLTPLGSYKIVARRKVIDAVGGVRVPFANKARDKRTGFKVLKADVCYTFEGDHALAYMRSRHYQWYDPALQKWRTDPSSDWGRIARQQDFMRRLVKKALDKARTNPRVATGILNAALKNVITDDRLNALTVLQLGQAMKNFDANTMGSYTMPGIGQVIDKASVIVPDFESDQSKKILSVFQGKASLSTTLKKTSSIAPATEFTELASVIAATSIMRLAISKPAVTTTTSSTTTTTTTVPAVVIQQATKGIVPIDDPNCQF
jgi:hypothetical protein